MLDSSPGRLAAADHAGVFPSYCRALAAHFDCRIDGPPLLPENQFMDQALGAEMLNDFRCGKCNKLLAQVGEYTRIQVKCARCGTLNHLKAASLCLSPLSETIAATTAQ